MGALEFEPATSPETDPDIRIKIDSLVEVAKEALSKKEAFGANLNQDRKAAIAEILRLGTSAGGQRAKAIIAYNKDTGEVRSGQVAAREGFDYYLIKLAGEDLFPSVMQEYCYAFFKIGTPHCFDAFKELSEKMLSYYPGNTVYMTNLGSYYLVYKHDSKTALKMYNKVLKKSPDDYTAIKNCVLLARSDRNTKLERKYLPMLIRVTPDETEKASAQARLDALK